MCHKKFLFLARVGHELIYRQSITNRLKKVHLLELTAERKGLTSSFYKCNRWTLILESHKSLQLLSLTTKVVAFMSLRPSFTS